MEYCITTRIFYQKSYVLICIPVRCNDGTEGKELFPDGLRYARNSHDGTHVVCSVSADVLPHANAS